MFMGNAETQSFAYERPGHRVSQFVNVFSKSFVRSNHFNLVSIYTRIQPSSSKFNTSYCDLNLTRFFVHCKVFADSWFFSMALETFSRKMVFIIFF